MMVSDGKQHLGAFAEYDARPKHHPCVEQHEGNIGIDIFTMIVVAFTKRQDIIRIISARKANDREKKRFKDAIADRLETDRFHEG
jgi:uncharacterized DUF497 family protein